MPSARFSHTALVDAPRAHVWKALDKPETWNAISGVERVHQPVIDNGGRLRGFLFDTMVGGTAYEGKATPRSRDEERLMAWDIANSQVKGHIDIELADADPGTRVLVTIEIASASFLAGMFFGAITKAIGDGLPQTVEALAAKLAQGQ